MQNNSSVSDPVVLAERLTKVYDNRVTAVRGLNLRVQRGEIFGLLGPNGAGKTTTAGMFTARITPTSGRAWVNGVDVWRRPTIAKRLIGVVPQANTLDRSLTVRDNLLFHGRYFGMSKAAAGRSADQLLAQFELDKRAHDGVARLSGGLAQRLMLARAIMHAPAVLFLDEPTTGLDPQSRIAFWTLLLQLNQAGQTVLLTTHYMEEAERLCHRLAIIDRGCIIALDTPMALRQAAGLATVISITAPGSLAALADVLRSALPSYSFIKVVEDQVQVGVQSTEGLLGPLVMAAEHAGFPIHNLTIASPSLETAFLHFTGKAWREA